jgi:tyrosine-protein kinase Etk/Wzc
LNTGKDVSMEQEELKKEEQEIHLIDLLITMLKHKRLILAGTVGLSLLTLVVCLIMTPIFEGKAVVMPPQQSSASSTVGQLLGQFAGVASMIMGAGGTTTGELYVGLLKSPAVVDPFIDRFDIMKIYERTTREDARDLVTDKLMSAEVDPKSSLILISAFDKDPKRSAEMANFLAVSLKNVYENISTSEAGKRRAFFDAQLKKTHEDLKNSEAALASFAETTGAIRIDEQASAALAGIVGLRNLISSREVALEVMKTYASKDNPDLKRAQQELESLRTQLRKLEEREGKGLTESVIPTGQIPSLGMEYLRKMRDFKYSEMLYELLVKQFEAARLEEARESANVQIAYEAVPPERKAKPKTIMWTALAVAVGLFLSVFLAFSLEWFHKSAQDPQQQERFQTLKQYLKRF